MSDPKRKEGVEREKEHREGERTRAQGLHPSSIICLCCRCGRKEGRDKNLHKVIIIHMNADQILENCKHTHTHTSRLRICDLPACKDGLLQMF